MYMEKLAPIEQYTVDMVEKLRRANNLTMEQLGKILGVSKSFVGNATNPNDSSKYNLKHINILCDHFDISPQDFLPEYPMKTVVKSDCMEK